MLEIKNISFQVTDDNDRDKEIIRDVSLKIDDQKKKDMPNMFE